VRHTVTLDRVEDRDRFDFPEEHGVTAFAHPRQRPPGAADVEQRHGHETDTGRADAEIRGHPEEAGAEVGVGEHDALGEPGRARRVELDGHVSDPRLCTGVSGGVGLLPRVERVVLVVAAADDNDLANGRQLILDERELREELEAHHEDLGFGVVDDLGDLRGSQPPVDGDVDSVREGSAEQDVELRWGVLVEDRHPVLRAHALATQGGRGAAGALVDVGPGVGAALEREGRARAGLDGVRPDDAGNRPAHRATVPCGSPGGHAAVTPRR
jgi:hypothetical protein